MKTLISTFAFLLLSVLPAFASFTEPPVLIYGKVWDLNEGSTRQIFAGTLSLTLQAVDDTGEPLTVTTELTPLTGTDQWSYSVEIPQHYLAVPVTSEGALITVTSQSNYLINSASLEGLPVTPLDSTQSLLTTSFSTKAPEHRLDLQVSIPVVDTDLDGMPDWWEELYDLNPLSDTDASSNTDGDDWTALEEFINGGNPNVDNRQTSIANTTIHLPEGGSAGVWFPVIDSDDASTPEDITITLTAIDSSAVELIFKPGFGAAPPLVPSDSFTYAIVLEGALSVVAQDGFSGSSLSFSYEDGDGNTGTFDVVLELFNPESLGLPSLVAWLNADFLGNTYSNGDAITSWSSGGSPLAFQPTGGSEPTFDSTSGPSAEFSANEFLYLNTEDVDFSAFTLFALFSADTIQAEDSTLVHLGDIEVALGGTDTAPYAQTLMLRQDSDAVFGPSFTLGNSLQFTASGTDGMSMLTLEGTRSFLSQDTLSALAPAFPSIGANYALADLSAGGFFDGKLQELVLFSEDLSYADQTRVEDYQLSRWRSAVVWDWRLSVVPMTITGRIDLRNILTTGWGDDTVTGGDMDDILRGGPGMNRLTGGLGQDRFQFYLNTDEEAVTDFDVSEGDVIDLSPLLGSTEGTPESYVSFASRVNYPNGSAPTVDTLLQIDLKGDGGDPDQTIVLEGVYYTNEDLPWLIGEGYLYLGGPSYVNAVTVSSAVAQLVETEYSRDLLVTRTGNTSAAMDVDLSFVGSASVGLDYTLADVVANGVVQTVSFARDETSKTIALTPIQDVLQESEAIHVAVLPSDQLPASSEVFTWSLEDAPVVTITAQVPEAERQGSVPGVIEVARSGSTDAPLTVELSFGGSAINGEDFIAVAPLVQFSVGESSKLVSLYPNPEAADLNQPKVSLVSVVPDATQFATVSPWSASILFLDQLWDDLKTFDSYKANLSAPFNQEGALAGDADFISLFSEYVLGLDPTVADNLTAVNPRVFVLEERLVIEMATATGLTDVQLYLESNTGFGWSDADDLFAHTTYAISGEQLVHVFTSRQPVTEFASGVLYRLNYLPLTPALRQTDIAILASSPGQAFLTKGDSGWVPSITAAEVIAEPRDSGQSSVFSTSVTEADGVSFDWSVTANSGATLKLLVNGVEVDSWDDTSGGGTYDYTFAISGADYEVRWVVDYGTADSSLSTSGYASISNISIDPST